jgi:transposase
MQDVTWLVFVKTFLNQNHIRVLPWPALSPDLSPIEQLWDELCRRVRHRQNPPETLQELRDVLVHEWPEQTE